MKNHEIFLKRITEIAILLIILRLFYLQIYKGDFYQDLAQRNYMKSVILPAPRGIIYDRNGVILAENKIKYSLYLIPPYKYEKEKVRRLSNIIKMKEEDIEKLYKKISLFYPAVILKNNLDIKEILLLEENRDDLPLFSINIEFERYYPFGTLASHVIGYMGEVSKEELEDEECDYSLGEKSGKYGVESFYEKYLRGKKGFRGILLHASNTEKVTVGQKDPEPGKSLILSLDLNLQKIVEEALGEERGCVIVSRADTGEILSMASHPAFDPNKFITGFTKDEWNNLINDINKPLNNKAISALYPPGSIFKLIVALSALENKRISPNDTFYCSGEFHLGGYSYKCWKKGGHGRINFIDGIAQSCNIVFYNVGLKVGEDQIFKYAKDFMLDSKVGIDLPGEVKGFIPSKEWKEKTFKEPWYPGDTVNLSIGQGFVLVTPLEIHAMMSMIATEGILVKPHVVKGIVTESGIEEVKPEVIKEVKINKANWEILKEGMKKVVEEGTGIAVKFPGVEIFGKTGTAENPHGESHAWFSSYFRINNVPYVVTVFVEHGKSGGGRAAPIARKIIEYMIKGGSNIE